MKLRHILYEIYAKDALHKKFNELVDHVDSLDFLDRLFKELMDSVDTEEKLAQAVLEKLKSLGADMRGVSTLSANQVSILNKLVKQFNSFSSVNANTHTHYVYDSAMQIRIIEELLKFVINHGLLLDGKINTEKLVFLYQFYEPFETQIISRLQADMANLKPIYAKQKVYSDRCAEIGKKCGYITREILNGPSEYTNMSVDYLVLQLTSKCEELFVYILEMYKDGQMPDDKILALLDMLKKLAKDADMTFARRYDSTTSKISLQKVEFEFKRFNNQQLLATNIISTKDILSPFPDKTAPAKNQVAVISRGKNSASVPNAQLMHLEFGSGFDKNGIADLLNLVMQSYDNRVVAHFSAVTRLFDPVDQLYHNYVITVNKGRWADTPVEDTKKTNLVWRKNPERELEEDGGRTYLVYYINDKEKGYVHFDVEPASAPYFSYNNVPNVHIGEIVKSGCTKTFVLTVNDTVIQRMNHDDIQAYFNNEFSSRRGEPTAESLAEALHRETYRRSKSSEDKAKIDREANNIVAAVAEVTFLKNNIYLSTIFNFSEGVSQKINSEQDVFNTLSQLQQLDQKKYQKVELKKVQPEIEFPETEELPVELGGTKKKSAAQKRREKEKEEQLLAEAKLIALRDVISKVKEKNLVDLAESLQKFQLLAKENLVKDKGTIKLFDAVSMAVNCTLEAHTKNDLKEKAKSLAGAKIAVEELNHITQTYTQYEKVLGVVMSILAGIVLGTAIAVLLAATGLMPAAVVAAMTVTGWVATLSAPLAIGAGIVSIYGLFGTAKQRTQRQGLAVQNICLDICAEAKNTLDAQ